MIDLKRKTQTRVFELYDAVKAMSLEQVYNDQSRFGYMPLTLVAELYVGVRIMNMETE